MVGRYNKGEVRTFVLKYQGIWTKYDEKGLGGEIQR